MRKVELLLSVLSILQSAACSEPLIAPDPDRYTEKQAQRIIKAACNVLRPVYGPLAEFCVKRYRLEEKHGIGIDLGGGPGLLSLELAKRTRFMHWVNVDINTFFFSFFFKEASKEGLNGRVSALFADAEYLPFRSNYADFIVSRGSFHFWPDKLSAFAEIYRVLKPGGTALIGRGFSPNLPVRVAKAVRKAQEARGHLPVYDVKETRSELEEVIKRLGIKQYEFILPQPPGSRGTNYGIWLELHKPAASSKTSGSKGS